MLFISRIYLVTHTYNIYIEELNTGQNKDLLLDKNTKNISDRQEEDFSVLLLLVSDSQTKQLRIVVVSTNYSNSNFFDLVNIAKCVR